MRSRRSARPASPAAKQASGPLRRARPRRAPQARPEERQGPEHPAVADDPLTGMRAYRGAPVAGVPPRVTVTVLSYCFNLMFYTVFAFSTFLSQPYLYAKHDPHVNRFVV